MPNCNIRKKEKISRKEFINELSKEMKNPHVILQRELTNQHTDEGIDIVLQ